jgi:hypothetical protein
MPMLAMLLAALVIIVAALLAGIGLLALLGERRPSWLGGAIGLAALTVAAPLLIRLPGRAVTAAVILALALAAAAIYLWREGRGPGSAPLLAAITVVIVVGAACLPFLFNQEVGVLGEGIYTNDQAAQLYWAEWLQTGFGSEPDAVSFGYPTGPQSLVAVVAEATGTELDDAFNGLLVAIPALAALAALAALSELPPVRRVAAAALVGLPYLGASFLAQSAFKETAMALFVLAFAIALQASPYASGHQAWAGAALGRRAAAGAILILAAGAVLTYSAPGLVWFAAALPVWLVLERWLAGRPLPLGDVRGAIARHRGVIAAVAVVLIVVAVLVAGPVANFVSRIGDVQESTGRLSSPVFPGEALGTWPEGNFQIVRGEVDWAIPATILGAVAALAGALIALGKRQYAVLSVLGAAAVIYLGARAFASIYVDAKALAVMAPLVLLVGLGGLLAPAAAGGRAAGARLALGAVVAVAAGLSTLLALRDAPVGFDGRGAELESLADRVDGGSVVFLGVDRFAGYWLRGTDIASPGGYVPPEVPARPQKIWQQGLAMDLDTVRAGVLDRFDYAITTSAAYQSTPPPNMTEVARTDSYVLWERSGPTPPLRVLERSGDPGRIVRCAGGSRGGLVSRLGSATVLPTPEVGKAGRWSRTSPMLAPETAEQRLDLSPGVWQLSLQYHSQAPLTVRAPGLEAELPPSLVGMYLTEQGGSAFWPAGELEVSDRGPITITVSAEEPTGLQRALGVERRTWLGAIAAIRVDPLSDPPPSVAPATICDAYLDHAAKAIP